ncbi:MAG TPA: CHRD domain-containing protein [Steroidobacteraceae bacterium]|nr:CHRD domain-containing protein [Steroidobacteraceae bacterium]
MITPLRLRLFTHWTAALCATLLAACGGGYGGGGGGGGGCGAYGSCTPTVVMATAAGTVSGTVALSATAMAAGTYTVMSVQFKVDGTAVGAADTTAPYSYSWDSSSVADGSHMVSATVTDSVGQTATSASVTLTVNNAGTYPVTLTSGLLFPAVTTAATGSGSFTINYATGDTSGSVMLTGIVVTGAEIGDAYAGASSTALFALTQNAGNANEWDVPASTTLDAGQRADLAAGKLYVLVRTAANPNGELRAQLLPTGISVKVAALTGGAEVPAVVTSASGMVAVTVDSTGMMAAVHVNVSGLSATGAELDTGAAGAVGTQLAPLAVDALDPNHYLNEAVTLTAQNVTDYNNGMWYANVVSTAHVMGELRGQIVNGP